MHVQQEVPLFHADKTAGGFGVHGKGFVVEQEVESLMRDGIGVVYGRDEAEQVSRFEIDKRVILSRSGLGSQGDGTFQQEVDSLGHEPGSARCGDFFAEMKKGFPACFQIGQAGRVVRAVTG